MVEALRKLARGVINPQSGLYKKGASILDFHATVVSEGFQKWKQIQKLKEQTSDEAIPIDLKSLKTKFWLRPGTEDVRILLDSLIRKEYGKHRLPYQPKFIIDAGAFIGDSSLYFLNTYPNANIVALEPNPESYELAVKNLSAYQQNVTLLKKGLNVNEGKFRFSEEGVATGAGINENGFEIDCTSMASLLEQYNYDKIDILKMDIEGAEHQILESHPEKWLTKVGLLIIEVHSDATEKLLLDTLEANDFSAIRYRSLWYCFNRSNQ